MTTEMTTENTAVQVVQSATMSLKQIGDRVNLVHQVLKNVMKKGTHFGTVPGCGDKAVLLKPGADVLAMTFRLVPQFRVDRTEFENGHREYDVTCSMYGPDGGMLGQGVGSASTLEKKYRYRKDHKGNRVENEDIADVYNTVLKIAKKRAHIDATLTVTGAADLFTQDLIDEDDAPARPEVRQPARKTEPATERKAETQDPDAQVIQGFVERVTIKPTARNDRYGVLIDGTWYNTFDQAVGFKAKDLEQIEVKATVKPKGKFWDLLAIEPLAADEPEAPADTDTQQGPPEGADELPF